MNTVLIIIYVVLIIAPIYLIWAISKINSNLKKVEWLNAQEYTILRIDVPKNNDKAPLAAEQMFAAIHGIYSESAKYQNHLSFEIVSKAKFIQFYVYLPVHLKDFVEGQIYAQYPAVEINEVGDYTQDIDISSKNFAICELKLNKPDVYPIKQFTDFEVDPISGITSVMSKLNDDEEIWFQMVVKPVGDSWQEKGHSMVSSVRSGIKVSNKSIANKVGKGIVDGLKMLFMQAVRPGEYFEKTAPEVKLPASVEDALKNIETKITKLGFETKIRIMAISSDSISARMKCQNVAAAFKQYNTTNLNGFKVGDIYMNDQQRRKDFAIRSFTDYGDIFNIAELASIYHLPHSSVSTPNIVWSGSKKGEPPADLPLKENTPEEDLTIIGETNFRNVYRTFGIKRDDRRRHIYIVGKSGTGKSTLIENMAINDVMSGRGVIIVDPHGELADKVLSCIPENRINDTIIFDPSDREFPVAFNLLENVDDDFKSIVASGFVGIFKKIFGDSWGPRLEHIMRNTVFALLDYPSSTMLDIPRMLTNNRFRDKVLEKVKDPVIKEFWLNEFASFDSKFRTEAVSPILNKVGQFLSSSTIRNIVGQSDSSINIREIMDQQKIMIVNLSRGKIGEDNSALLGAMMVTKVQLAAMSRADTTVDHRPDCYLYVDEFQNFATESFAVILSEARKYNLNLTMAHQYIAQLPDEVKDAVFGNAGTLVTFRVGGTDAETLIGEFAPVFETNDLVNLDKYHIYIKLLINGISSPAFSARTLSPVQTLSGNIDAVIKQSRDKYSNTRAAVQESILSRSNQEEEELKAEAEAFRQGGLEALLLKKAPSDTGAGQSSKPSIDKDKVSEDNEEKEHTPVPVKWINADVKTSEKIPAVELEIKPEPKKEEEENKDFASNVAGDEKQENNDENNNNRTELTDGEKKPSKSRVIKYDSIIDGKIYKERTARGGVKWYLGEEIDEEKLAKSKVSLDDAARKIIEISKNVNESSKNQVEQGSSKKHKKDKSHRNDDRDESIKRDDRESNKKDDSYLDDGSQNKEVAEDEFGKHDNEATKTAAIHPQKIDDNTRDLTEKEETDEKEDSEERGAKGELVKNDDTQETAKKEKKDANSDKNDADSDNLPVVASTVLPTTLVESRVEKVPEITLVAQPQTRLSSSRFNSAHHELISDAKHLDEGKATKIDE